MKLNLRQRLLASTLLLGSPAYAQQEQLPGNVPEGGVEEGAEPVQAEAGGDIVVTGTRIASPNITAVQPVQVVNDEAIDISGATNVQEVLLENPAFGTPTLSRTNSAFLTSGTGVATVDLRDLGADRTLVLINGRRVVAGLPGSATVDLNIIPTQFVQRIDVLTGGASSVYGSDAVAGVVNFIYRTDFEGILAEGQYGITERGDDRRYQASVTAGVNSADDRGNIMLHVGYTNEGGLLSRKRRNTQIDDIDEFQFTGDPADYGTPREPFFSSFPPQGRFNAGGTNFTFSPTNQLQPCFTTNGTVCGGGRGVGPNGFNRQAFRTIAVPVERYLLAARGNYELTDGIRFIAEATFSKTNSEREIEPFPLSSDDIFPATGGLVPIETFVNGRAVLNPFVPGPIAAAARDEDGDGLRDISFARRLSEFGTRSGSTTRNVYRFVVGLEGDLFEDKFDWDVTYNYGSTSENQTSNGQVNVLNFANALRAIPDVNDANNNGRRDDVICASADARAQGCVPINIFGFGSVSQQAVQYIQAEQTFQTDIEQQVVQANLRGSLIELPAGPLAIAVGAEYRKESSVENNDALTNAGLNAGNAIPDTAGDFDVKEAYAEINIPILADRPFFHALNLRAAGRISDYSTVGTVYSYSAGADFAPIPDIRFRGTYARAVRAPNIGELFTGPSQTFPTGLQDPCVNIGPTGGGALGDRCRAAPGVLANILANGVFTINQSDLQGISGFNSGNPNLEEEKSDSYTAGVVINPTSITALRGLVLSVDYFNIKVDDAIVAPPRQFILNQCFQGGVQQFCDLIQRRATATAVNSPGSLEFINAPLFNGGELKVEGIDTVLTYTTPLDRLGINMPGRLFGRVSYTHYFEGFITPVPGADRDPFVGEIGTSDDRFTATLGYSNDTFRLSFTGTYIGPAFEDNNFLAQFGLEPDAVRIPAQFYLDTQVSFNATERFEFYLGADNLLNNDAPNILSGSPFNVTGTDTAADVYDVFGRRFYVGARLRF
jgi:outer membrane receptor protein involved in Fe transport